MDLDGFLILTGIFFYMLSLSSTDQTRNRRKSLLKSKKKKKKNPDMQRCLEMQPITRPCVTPPFKISVTVIVTLLHYRLWAHSDTLPPCLLFLIVPYLPRSTSCTQASNADIDLSPNSVPAQKQPSSVLKNK